jgi:transcriptional regulator with XRE-family HTH domain
MTDLIELKAEMVRRRVRQRQVAKRLEISEGYLSDVLNGVKAVDSELRRAISEAIKELADGIIVSYRG